MLTTDSFPGGLGQLSSADRAIVKVAGRRPRR